MKRPTFLPPLLPALAAALGLALGPGRGAADVIVFGRVNFTNQGVSAASPGGEPRPNRGGTFDIHAAAQVQGATGGAIQTRHIPTQADPFFATFFPLRRVGILEGTGGPTGPRLQDRFTTVIDPKTLPTPHTYTSAPKDYERVIPFITPTAFRTAVGPANGLRSIAEAEARIKFVATPDNKFSVTAEGSYVRAERQQVNMGGNLQQGPDNKAATLVRDPMLFGDIRPGDVVRGTITLSASDFRVQILDDGLGPPASFGSVLEVGTNLFGPSPGPLGFSSDGNQLLFRLETAFQSGGLKGLGFEVNSAVMADGSLVFLDPENGDQVITGDVGAFVISRLDGALVYDADSGTWSLSRDVSLFTYQLTARESVSELQLDYLSGQIAETGAVPEPSALALLGAGAAALAAGAWWRHRRAS